MIRAAELTGVRQFRFIECELPPPQPGEVQVEVRSVGICGSDIHYYSEGSIGDTKCVFPMVLGHEPTGVVAAVGAGVTGWNKGDAAILEPAIYCYHCESCLAGRHNVCANIRFLSTPGEPGFFRDRVNLPAGNLMPMPRGVSFDEATLFEPLAIILHSLEFAKPRAGETAIVYGAGPIGALTVAMLKIGGVSRVWCVEPVAHRRETALCMGADSVLDPFAVDPVAQVMADTGKRGVDMAIDCATRPATPMAKDTISQCLDAAANSGRVVITGIPSEAVVQFPFHVMRRKELYFYSVRRSNHETAAALRLLEEKPKLFGPLVTHSRPFDDIGRTFDMATAYADGVGKAVVRIS